MDYCDSNNLNSESRNIAHNMWDAQMDLVTGNMDSWMTVSNDLKVRSPMCCRPACHGTHVIWYETNAYLCNK